MVKRILNLLKLIQIIQKRGNWDLIKKSQKQLVNFIFCRNELVKKSWWNVIPYWYYMLKGLDVLVWRLETFGFLYPQGLNEEQKRELNRQL